MEYRRTPKPRQPKPTNLQLGLRPGTYSYERRKTWTYYPDIHRRSSAEGLALAKLKCTVDADCSVYVSAYAIDHAMGVEASRAFTTSAILDGFILPDALTFGRATDLLAACVDAFIAEATGGRT